MLAHHVLLSRNERGIVDGVCTAAPTEKEVAAVESVSVEEPDTTVEEVAAVEKKLHRLKLQWKLLKKEQ